MLRVLDPLQATGSNSVKGVRRQEFKEVAMKVLGSPGQMVDLLETISDSIIGDTHPDKLYCLVFTHSDLSGHLIQGCS